MTLNFSNLLKKPAGKAKKPEALPAGNYPGVIKSYEIGDNNRNKTPYVRFALGITDWADTVSDDEKTSMNSDGNREPIDLSKRQPRRDFYLTDEALHRLDTLLRSLGVNLDGRDYESALPDVIGSPVMIELQQYLNEKTSEIGNQVGNLTGQQ